MSGALLQTAIVLVVVVGAAAYLGLRAWRAFAAARRARGEAGCGSGCGCSPAPVAPRARRSKTTV